MVKNDSDPTLYSYDNEEALQFARKISSEMYRYDQIEHDRISNVNEMSEADVQKFWKQGYLVIDHLIDQEKVNHSIEAIMDILKGVSQGAKIQFVRNRSELHSLDEIEMAARKIYDYVEHEPRLYQIANDVKILELMGKLFKEEAKIAQNTAILKPPGGGAEKPWHQDMAYGPLAYDKSVIGLWIALDPAELDNGCMHVIPYSHREGAVPHFAERDWQLCDKSVQVSNDVAVPLKPGGALVFSGLLHHGTPPNFSTKRRRSLQIHYAPASAIKLTPTEYKLLFKSEFTRAEC
jgi:phytanoyl-CoA hydroxylase